MPYQSKQDIPSNVQDSLPPHAEKIYKEAFNSAWEQYADPQKRTQGGDREEVAHKVAWSAVKKAGYAKNNDGMRSEWIKE